MKKTIIYYIFKVIFAALFIIGGIAHFTKPEFYLPMMPNYLPYHIELIYISGVIEIVLGFLLLIPRYSQKSALGIVLLLIAVFPANINMYLNAQNFPDVGESALLIRLPIQAILIIWAYYYTKNISKKG